MKASAMELRHSLKEIIAAVDRGEEVTIVYRGKERAVLVPLERAKKARGHAADHPAFGMWKDRQDMEDVSQYVRQLRQARFDGAGGRPCNQ